MNNTTLEIFVANLNSRTTSDNLQIAEGQCLFKYEDRKIEQKASLNYQCYGSVAEELIEIGDNSVLVINGRLHLYKPEEGQGKNPVRMLVIEQIVATQTAPERGESTEVEEKLEAQST